MIRIKDKTECCGCHACFNACPTGAIKMVKDEKGFKYPKIDKSKCINCGLCEKVCPIKNNTKVNNKPIAYACFNKDANIRLKSSSGGVFTLLATYIINQGGVVFGAAFDEKFNVKHIKIENKEDLECLRGSKYVQSSIGETYKQAKDALNKGAKVLFTGTPCQIEGLRSFLQRDYDNLYTQDIICHGVPSPKVWRKYLEFRKEMDKKEPIDISFRNKDNGWANFSMVFAYQDDIYKKTQFQDLYMNVFLQNISLRESCYKCSFKKYNRISDITLADFWGVSNILPEINDDKGTSLVIVNSEKGKELFENVSNNLEVKNVNLDDAIKYNSAMIKSVPENPNREKFFDDLENEDFDVVAKRYIKRPSLIRKILGKIKRMIK